jgi:hypothetical protein
MAERDSSLCTALEEGEKREDLRDLLGSIDVKRDK